ncbi:alkaline phosphatase family protein [Streptomyces sp. NPDC051907]|uniref:alkaline phosphatase family protein n=1 Tax=Streptomyces sp. NPDC051907 TaxID=3155284 RepID=UPI00343A682F
MALSPGARLALATLVVTAATLSPAGPAQAGAPATTADRPAADAMTYKSLPNGTRSTKTLVIGVDGAAFDVLAKTELPRLKSLMTSGMTGTGNLYAAPLAGTYSGPGWSSIATGVWPDKHRVTDNNFSGAAFDKYPDYSTRLEAADPAFSTLVVGNWPEISTDVFGAKTDLRLMGDDDTATTATAADYLRNGNPDSVFVHLDEVDLAGHMSGSASAEYTAALKQADRRIGRLLDAVAARSRHAKEDWLVLVTADHGHTPLGGHGGNTPGERKTFVIARGKGIPAGSVRHDVKITDIAPTVLAHQGVTPSPAWNLDGKAIPALAPDAFDSLRGSLKPRADETRPGADVKGWTTTPPKGWTVDNSRTPAGGVTEWRGWSFATDEFWTNTQLGQGREANVRARNVFAVADSDEWDDRRHDAGRFDSTLISPDHQLISAAPVTVGYASHYRLAGPQTGEVYAVWDDGEPVLVKSYRNAVNTYEKLRLTPPRGASTLQLRFRYTGANSAFWTVDQVTVRQGVSWPGVDIPLTAVARTAIGH